MPSSSSIMLATDNALLFFVLSHVADLHWPLDMDSQKPSTPCPSPGNRQDMPTMAMSPEGAAVLVVPAIFEIGRARFRDDSVESNLLYKYLHNARLCLRVGVVHYLF